MDLQSISGLTINLSEVSSEDIKANNESYGQQYDIVSKVAYLIGFPKKIFENEKPPMLGIYDKMKMDEVLDRTRIRMTRSEIDSFINRRIKNNLRLEIFDDGSVKIAYRCKK